MNREILFRGKRVDNGKWIYGSLVKSKHGCFIVYGDVFDKCDEYLCYGTFETAPVIPETIGQYTGLTDENGKKIFEGDVILFNTYIYGELEKRHKAVVKYDGEYNRFAVFKNGAESYGVNMYLYNTEVIGNIHDGGNE